MRRRSLLVPGLIARVHARTLPDVSRLNRDQIHRLAIALATDLCRNDPPVVRGEMSKVAAAAANAIATNFAEEASIHKEAEKALEMMARQNPELDPTRLLRGLRERIAKKRGFVL